MFAGNWFGKRHRQSQHGKRRPRLKKGIRRKHAPRSHNRALHVEALEDRRLLAVYVVNNPFDLDAGGNVVVGSLRQAINLSNASNEFDQIVFADFLFTDPVTGLHTPQTIILDGRAAGGEFAITDDVQILGPGADTTLSFGGFFGGVGLTILGGAGNNRIFNIDDGSENNVLSVTIGGMTLTGGSLPAANDASRGGAIRNAEALTVIESIIQGNSASRGGGGIFVEAGSLTLERSLVVGNTSGGGGGGILNGSADTDADRVPFTSIVNSTLAGNSTFGINDRPGFGGGVFNRAGIVDIAYSTLSGNSASAGGGGVATYGVDPEEDDPITIVTSQFHTISHNNLGGDLMTIFHNNGGALISPRFFNDRFNIIGSITVAT